MSTQTETKTRGPADPKRLQRRRFVLKLPVVVTPEIAAAVEDQLAKRPKAFPSALALLTDLMEASVELRCKELHRLGSPLVAGGERQKLDDQEKQLLARLQEVRGRKLALGAVATTDEVTAALIKDPNPLGEPGEAYVVPGSDPPEDEDYDEADEPEPEMSPAPATSWEQAKTRA